MQPQPEPSSDKATYLLTGAVVILAALLAASAVYAHASKKKLEEGVPPEQPLLSESSSGNNVHTMASSQLESSWAKTREYEFSEVVRPVYLILSGKITHSIAVLTMLCRMTQVSVQEVSNPELQARYDAYKVSIGSNSERLVFHGCAPSALDPSEPDNIPQHGFLKKFWKTAAGDWQRFGPGFYFALQSSKSHEYPLHQMSALRAGQHQRAMLLCKVRASISYTIDDLPA